MNLNDWEDMVMHTTILDQARVVSRIQVPSHVWNSATLNVGLLDPIIQDLVLSLESTVLRETLPPEKITEEVLLTTPPVPVTWWDHFKKEKLATERWYWRWLGKLKPPLYEVSTKTAEVTVNLQRYWNYPDAAPVPTRVGQPVRFATYDHQVALKNMTTGHVTPLTDEDGWKL